MNDKQVKRLIKIFYNLATILILIGAFFRIQHYPQGKLIAIIGFMLGTFTCVFENYQLKKKLRLLEEKCSKIEADSAG